MISKEGIKALKEILSENKDSEINIARSFLEDIVEHFEPKEIMSDKEFAEYVKKNSFLTIVDKKPKIGEWIPCSDDNLPEKEVLCCDRYGEMMFGYVSKAEEGTYNAESEHEYMYDCVAWQPLPEPYKKGKENEKV